MTKSDLVKLLVASQPLLSYQDIESAVKLILEQMSSSLSAGDRIEIRGFGSFALHHRPARMARNPKSGEVVMLAEKYVPHFKPGKELRDRVNNCFRFRRLAG